MQRKIFFGLAVCIMMISCFRPATEFISYNDIVYEVRDPCAVKIVKKLPEDISKYIMMGICKSNKTAQKLDGDGNPYYDKYADNEALKEVWNCACKNGGDYAVIKAAVSDNQLMQGSETNQPYRDYVEVEVYRIKETE